MTRADPSPHRRLERFLPLFLLLGALLLASAGFLAEVERRADRDEVVERIAELDLPAHRRAGLTAWAARGDDPVEIRVEAARRLVHQALAGGGESPEDGAGQAAGDPGGDSAQPAGAVPPLDLAGAFAAEAVARRPASWRAAHLLASSIYLRRSRDNDLRLVTAASDWNRPLERARMLAPAAGEPVRFQTAAYLELWPTLPQDRRDEARALLRRALTDAATFDRLILAWLAIADADNASLAETLAVIPPDDPRAWRTLGDLFARQGDWRAALEARSRWRGARVADLEHRLEAAAALKHGGRPYEARLAYLEVVAAAPTETTFAPLVADALAAAPPGTAEPRLAEPLRRWLDWARALERVGANPIPDSIGRLEASVAGTADPATASETDWQQAAEPGTAGPTHRREVRLERPAAGLRIEGAAGGDGLVEVRLDGRMVTARRARPGRPLEVEAALSPGLHLVEVVAVHGGFRPDRLAPLPVAVQGAGAGGGTTDGD